MEDEFDIAKAEAEANARGNDSVSAIALAEANASSAASGYDAQFETPLKLTGKSGIGDSMFDGQIPFSELDNVGEIRARRQPWIAKASAGIGRVGAKVASEIAKMPGVVGGVAAGTIGQIVDGATGEDNTDFMQVAFNNAWIKGINQANEFVNEEALPVYVKKSVEEGNLWENITSIDFWATEGADGLGYIISMLAPGAAINKLGIGSKLAKGVAGATRGVGKYSKMGNSVDKALSNMSKLGINSKNADLHMSTMANTLFEAGAEAQGAMEGYTANLQAKLDAGEITQEEFDVGLQDASRVGRDVFLFNTAVLVGPNAVMSKMIWGGKTNVARGIKATEKGFEMSAKPGLLKKAGTVGRYLGTGAAREGFFEEGMQSAGEKYISGVYENDEEYSLDSFVSAYGDMLQSTEGQKAIFLGAVFGGGMQGYYGAKRVNQDRKKTEELAELGNKQLEDLYNVLNEDIYARNESGEIVLDEEGNPEYDVQALISKMQGAKALENLSGHYDLAVEKGDTETIEKIKEVVTTNLVMPFIADERLGLEVLREHLIASKDISKIAEREGKRADQYVEEIMDKAAFLEGAHKTFTDFASDVINVDHGQASEEDFTKFYNKLNTAYIINKSRDYYLNNQLKKAEEKIDKLLEEKGISRSDFENNGRMKNQHLSTDIRLEKVYEASKEYKKALAENKDEANKMWSRGEANKKFAAQVDERIAIEKQVEEKAKEAEDAIDNIEDAKTTTEVDEIAKGKSKDEEVRAKEEAAVNELIERANSNPSINNLKAVLNDLDKLKISSFSIQDVLDNIEQRIKDTVQKQAEMREYLDRVFDAISQSINETSGVIADLNESIKIQKRKRNKIARDLSKEDKNPKGRNAKLIKQLIEETEKELRFIDRAIERLEKEKEQYEKELNKLEDQLEFVSERYDQVEISEFANVEDIIDFLKENSKKFGEHRFDLERLLLHKHYTEQNIEGLEEIISGLETYKQVLQETLREKLKDLDSSSHDLYFLQEQLNDTNEQLEEAKDEFEKGQDKLKRLSKALIDKQAISAITEELEFWEELKKARKNNPPSIALNNPVVNKAVIDKKRKLAEEKLKEKERKEAEATKAVELAEAFDKLREEGVVSNETYYNYVEDHMNEGEQLPNPPEGFPIPKAIKDKAAEIPYYLHKRDDSKLTFSRGGATFQVSRASFSDTKKTEVSSETSPVYETEGGPADTYVETAQNLPKDKDGNIIEENLQTVKNDARVITGTDGDANLPYVPKAMVGFERKARNKTTEKVGFEVNTKYEGNNENQKKALAMLPNATPNDLEFLINHLPLNAVFEEGIYAPLETYNTNPNLSRESRAKYDQIFDRTSKPLRTAIIKEMVLNKTDISNITTTIAGQKNGSITVAPKQDGKVVENSILELADIAGKMGNIKTKDIYVVNDKGTLENVDGDIQDLGKDMAAGELYLMIKTANGTPFPLKLNVKKVTRPEAELLFEIYNHRFEKGTKKANKAQPITETNETIVNMVKDVFGTELEKGGLFAKNKKTLDDLTVADVVNFLIWDGTKSMKSQVRFDATGGLRVFDKTYRKEDFANSREEFIGLLTSEEKGRGKRRNISFKRRADEPITSLNLQNRSYLEYLINNKILNTNAITGKDENGNWIPTFQGDTTIYLNTNNVRVDSQGDKNLSEYNVEKKIVYKNTLRGSEADLKRREKGLYTDELVLVEEGKDSYYVQKRFKSNPKRYRWERVSKVTALKDKDLTAANMYNAAKRGDVIDELLRVYFSKGFANVNEFTARAVKEVEKVNKKKDKYGKITMSNNSFKELWNIAKEYEIEFNKRGYTIYANTNPLFGELVKDKKKVKVGGAMDLLAKDKLGAYHIIDIKTSSLDRHEDYTRSNSYYREKDRRQQNAYAELFYQRTGKRVSSILIMPITVKSEKDQEASANSLYRNIARSKSPTGFIEVDMSKDIFELMGEKKPSSIDTRKSAGYKKQPKGKRGGSLLGEFSSAEMNQADDQAGRVDTDFVQESFEDDLAAWGEIDIDSFSSSKKGKSTPKKAGESSKKPKPSSRSAQPVDVGGTRYLLWNDGVITTLDNRDKAVKDQKVIDKVLATAGKKAAPGGKSEEEVRKDEKKSVSLQKTKEVVSKVNTSSMSNEEAKAKILELIRIRSLDKTIAKELRGLYKKEGTEQQKLQEMMDMLLEKASANEEVREICNIK